MSTPWTVVNAPATNNAATATQSAPTNGLTTGQTLRLKALMVCMSAGSTVSNICNFVVRDGASGVGTILVEGNLSVGANFGQSERLTGIDVRASVGNALTIEFTTAGGTGVAQTVWAEGDIIPSGYPAFQ